MTRKLSLALGILLAVGAFVGVLLLGSVVNPSPYHVVVAITEIQPGTVLEEGMVGIDAQVVSPQVAGEYVLAEELDRYLGKYVIRGLAPGQPLMHRDLVAADNPAARRRLALALEDPDLVAMVIPVQDNAPDGIVPGDRIGIVWSVGEAGFLAGPAGGGRPEAFGAPSTPEGYAPGGSEGVEPSLPGGVELPPEAAAVLGEAATGPTPEVSLPLAKTIVDTAQVIRVRREREANPAYTGQEGESPYIEGRVIGLEVAVAREEVEAIQFAVANGEYSIVVLSPNADPAGLTDASTLGVMWQDVVAYFEADRLRALGVLTVTGPIRPAGASSIYGAVLAPGAGGSPLSGEPPVASGATEAPTPTPAESGGGEAGEAAEATPTPPAALPTATPAAAAVEEPAPAPQPTPGGTLPVATNSLLMGVGCVAAVLLAIGGTVALVVRALRRRGRTPAP
ncbi:MAG TPA: hypothetical protein ENI39_08050 [Anaerolineae bacterium]|nr:hypothetical protein [Anaerolineae bacterium]